MILQTSVRKRCDYQYHEAHCNDGYLLCDGNSGQYINLREGKTVTLLVGTYLGQSSGRYLLNYFDASRYDPGDFCY